MRDRDRRQRLTASIDFAKRVAVRDAVPSPRADRDASGVLVEPGAEEARVGLVVAHGCGLHRRG